VGVGIGAATVRLGKPEMPKINAIARINPVMNSDFLAAMNPQLLCSLWNNLHPGIFQQ
jgi:hypothetical protein